MSSNSKLYRNFIILQEDERGYANASDKTLSGYSKIEARGDKCKISFYAQNLRKDDDKYYIMLICTKKDMKQLVNLGALEVSDSGKGEITKEYDIYNIGGVNLPYDKISGATICKIKEGVPIYVMYGFLNGEQPSDAWKSYKTIMGSDVKPSYVEKLVKKEDKKDHKKDYKKDDKKEYKKDDCKKEDKKDYDKEDHKKEDKKDHDKKDYDKKDCLKEDYKKYEKMKCEKREENEGKVEIAEGVRDNFEKQIESKFNKIEVDEVKISEANHIKVNEVSLNNTAGHTEENESRNDYILNNVYEVKENLRGKFEDYEDEIELSKNQYEDEFKVRGSIGEYFENIAQGFEQYRKGFEEIKYCKWYKIPINDLYEMSNVSNYNKYTLAYYPMLNYYPYIKKYGYFMLGYKCDSDGNLKYIVYAIPGKKDRDEQPYDGRTGFVTWIDNDDSNNLGYWLMFYDFKNSTVVVPMQ